jgi:hypothetical protein
MYTQPLFYALVALNRGCKQKGVNKNDIPVGDKGFSVIETADQRT